MTAKQKKTFNPASVSLPFPLVVIELKTKTFKKKCCKKYKKGKRCKSCPNG